MALLFDFLTGLVDAGVAEGSSDIASAEEEAMDDFSILALSVVEVLDETSVVSYNGKKLVEISFEGAVSSVISSS